MQIDDALLRKSEIINLKLRKLFEDNGYTSYRMSKFEEYDLYAENKDFLVSDNVITFTDASGKLMALKPDVTLSIIKNSRDVTDGLTKVYYNENVYRTSKNDGIFREIMQSGIECFGSTDEDTYVSVLCLAAEALRLFDREAVIVLSDLDIIDSVFGATTDDIRKTVFDAFSKKDLTPITALCDDKYGVLSALSDISGTVAEVMPKLDALLGGDEKYPAFRSLLEKLGGSGYGDCFRVDFSVSGDINYYNGIVFKGIVKSSPTPVLSGGRYDRLMKKLGRKAGAIGFAVYTDLIERDFGLKNDDGYINIALPKGRLGEKVYSMFAEAGYECPEVLGQSRKLIFENEKLKIRYFWVKPSDVSIYVERGAADIGVAGKDIIEEYSPDVYELLDLGCGRCRMAVAAPVGFKDDTSKTLRVATKFTSTAMSYYRGKGRDIDIINLNGSIEIAPILGLSDVIVDIVETGTTLKENDLTVIEEIMPISARLIANKTAFGFKSERTEIIAEALRKVRENRE
ncbi:MAG: ATP phosphoribosyltransferase [Firmicutes bacterium]|nr:ATP phosphoribosyltransferase [Candidatus Colimorpha enterica]